MTEQDIRWKQRFDNYKRALKKLKEAITEYSRSDYYGQNILEFIEESLIQRFEYTQELAWKVMKDYLEYQGYNTITGSRDTFKLALRTGLIADEMWFSSIADRNLSSHNYDEETAKGIVQNIITNYLPLFNAFERKMTDIENCL